MKKILGSILLLAAALAALTSVAEVQVSRTLTGTVVSRDSGEPIEFATVSVRGLESPTVFHRVITGAGGQFRVEGLVLGRYRIEVSHDGHYQVVEGLSVGRGPEEFAVRIQMRSTPDYDPLKPDLVLVDATGVRRINDADLGDDLARREVSDTRERKDPAMASIPEANQDIATVPATELEERDAVTLPKQASPYVRGGRSREVSQRVGGLAVANPTASGAEVLQRLATGADEIWILERSHAQRPVNPEDPGTGCLMVIREDEEIPVPLEHTEVHARIDGYIASVDVRQRFHNPFDETIEAEYVFPLPHDAAVNDFLMIVGERRIRGIIREKEEARELYERARQMGHVASLLEQERPNIFKQRVANIEPGNSIEVELHYFNALPYRDGEFEFAFPLVVGPRFNPPGSKDPIEALPRGTQPAGTGVTYLAPHERSGHDVAITVELDAGLAIQDLQSLNHATTAVRDGRERALVRLSRHDSIPNKDFVLSYRVAGDAVNSEVLVHREGEDGFFTMMLVPPASLEGLRRAPVEFVFVLDCSGSMNGWPMEKSKSAMRRALQQLQEGDSFQIVRFSESASALGPVPVEATEANIRRGLDYVDRLHGSGGTMMIEGIKAALDFPHDPDRERIVTFMTDGYIGNEAEIFGAISERLGETRIFSFGVGQSVNRHLIEGMARMGRGAVAYIGLQDDLDAVDQFYQAVRHPALTEVTIDWGGMDVEQVFPQKAHDLFVGRPVLMHGRYTGSGDATVRVQGNAGGQRIDMEIDVDLDGGVRREALPLIWARSELQHISDQLAREADESLEHRGLDLALDYNLVSNWTSFVAVDASEVVDEPGTRTEPVPVPVPDGVNYDTTVGGQGR